MINHIRKFVEINDSEIPILNNYLKRIDLKKKEFLIKEGQICNRLYFVEKGCLRMYFINDKGIEQIMQFALESWWISDYYSYIDNKPSDYYIQSIEKSEIISIDMESYDLLIQELPKMEGYFRQVMLKAVAQSQLRIKLHFDLSKEELYKLFTTSFPDFAQRVPQYMLASYLDLTPEYVSELRKKKL